MTNLPTTPLTPLARQGNTGFAMDVSLLLLRLMLGAVFIYHGGQKLFGWFDGKGMTPFIESLAKQELPILSPTVWAYVAAGGEFFGGIAVLIGLLARLGSIPIIVTMIVAILTVHGKNGFAGFRDPVKGLQSGYEYNLALIAMAAVVLIAGPGLISVDAFLFRRGLWARGPQPLSNPVPRSPQKLM